MICLHDVVASLIGQIMSASEGPARWSTVDRDASVRCHTRSLSHRRTNRLHPPSPPGRHPRLFHTTGGDEAPPRRSPKRKGSAASARGTVDQPRAPPPGAPCGDDAGGGQHSRQSLAEKPSPSPEPSSSRGRSVVCVFVQFCCRNLCVCPASERFEPGAVHIALLRPMLVSRAL